MKKIDLFKDRRDFFSKMLITGTGSLAFLSLSGCNSSDSTDSTVSDVAQLTDEQKDELFYIYQEEKLARDVYITLGIEYPNENTFAYIQLSEQRHIDSAQMLCEKYGIDLSEVSEDTVGNFVLPVLQELYDTLVAQGSPPGTLLDALNVGVFIEELDIHDLTHVIEDLGMPDDVVNVYTNLREGSYNHLEAFENGVLRNTPTP